MLRNYISDAATFIRIKMRCCTILVVGCNHGIQYREDPLFDTPIQTEQKGQFATFIDGMIKGHNVQFVAEEWGLAEISAARAIAEANSQSWANINTSFAELQAMGIPNDYADGDYPPGQKTQWNRRREEVMVNKLREQRGAAERLMVLCGFDHMEPLAQSLRKTCRFVASVDYRTLGWYDRDAFRH